MNRFQTKLKQLEARDRLRALKPPDGLDLTSCDYLGLRTHPALRAAALEAIEGGIALGAGGSRLLRGNTPEHEALEAFAADYFGTEKALYFATGYQANQSIFSSLPGRRDVIVFDSLIHASARDGIQSSAARHVRAAHNDLNAYEDALKEARERGAEQIWIAVESIYSMDGDCAPLADLSKLAQRYEAMLVVDEAHATGIFGPGGKGLTEGTRHENLMTLHTCGKALGVAGGLVCGPAVIVDTLVNRARGFIYSTAPPPLSAVLVQRALEIVRDEPQRREKLLRLVKLANELLPVADYPSQIIPVILGEDARAVAVAAALQGAGYDIRAIRPPTVPEGTARLRVSLTLHVDEQSLCAFAHALAPHLRREAA